MKFREIEGYQVSVCGVILGRRGRPLISYDNGKGYDIVSVTLGGKHTSKAVHRFVAEAWIENPYGLEEVNHIDCNRRNNSVDNLEWCTHSYNIEYSYKTLGRSALGENNARCLTTEMEVREICELLQLGNTAVKVRDMGYSYSTVRKIKARTNWQHVSKQYIW